MRVIVTRPQAQALLWVQALAGHGIDALAVPLIEIRPLADTSAVCAAWRRIDRCQALMFVSAAAVDHFFAARPAHGGIATAPDGPRFWATGPGTVAALVHHGVRPDRIDAPGPDSERFDSEALWRVVGARVQASWQVMLVRGADRDVSRDAPPTAGAGAHCGAGIRGQGRDWLATQLAQCGARVDFVVAYWRAAPAAHALRQALHDHGVGDGAVWLFTSGQAIAHLQACLAGHDWSRSRAIASHVRIADAARAAGFGVVRESRPALADMVASIKSLQ